MPTVKNPPALVAQETPAWCFAAAEVMVRNYLRLPPIAQYDIARRITESLANLDPAVQEQWQIAQALDLSTAQKENGGANLQSEIVQMVRLQWNAFDNAATGGRFFQNLDAQAVKNEIDNNRIFVIGTSYHYYVVYGYADDGRTLLLRDPWPAGKGGLKQQISLADFVQLPAHVVIFFDRA